MSKHRGGGRWSTMTLVAVAVGAILAAYILINVGLAYQ